jgi:hypothetical protein
MIMDIALQLCELHEILVGYAISLYQYDLKIAFQFSTKKQESQMERAAAYLEKLLVFSSCNVVPIAKHGDQDQDTIFQLSNG